MSTTRKISLFLLYFLAIIGFSQISIQKKILLQSLTHDSDDDNDYDANLQDSIERENHTSTDNYFDMIEQRTYKKAIITPSSNKRTPFSLSSWKRGTGGLSDEDRLTLGEIYHSANSVFEFGLGESTLIAAAVGVPRYAGVDSDAMWVSKARAESKMDHFRFYFADIGRTKDFGNPVKNDLNKIAYNYQISSLASEHEGFDVYLVDGRYRVACACASFLHAMKHGADMTKVLVAVHDNDEKGRGYHVMKKVADVVVKNKKLWVYKLKDTATQADLFQIWTDHEDIQT